MVTPFPPPNVGPRVGQARSQRGSAGHSTRVHMDTGDRSRGSWGQGGEDRVGDGLPEGEALLPPSPAPGQRSLLQRRKWAAGPGRTIAQRTKGRPVLFPGQEGSSVQLSGEPWDQPGVTRAPSPGPGDPEAPAQCESLSGHGPPGSCGRGPGRKPPLDGAAVARACQARHPPHRGRY